MVEINEGGRLRLNLHPGQMRAWHSDKRFVFIIAGTQSGKTSFGPWWLYREIQKHGRGDYLAVTANYDLFKLKMLPELTEVFIETLGVGRYWSSIKTMELRDPETGDFWAVKADDRMWGRIILRSSSAGAEEAGVSGLESTTAKAAWLDEPGLEGFPLQAWEAILRRLSLELGRVLGTTTPYNLGWLYQMIYTPWTQGDPDIDIIQFDSTENPLFPEDEYERAKRTLPQWKFNMLYRGKFDRPAGMIYHDFDQAHHVVDPFTIPWNWIHHYVGVDPGALHTAVVYMVENPETHALYLYKETLEGNLTSAEHAGKALEHAAAYPHAQFNWCGGTGSEKQFRWDWQAAKVPINAPSVIDVESGIDRVIGLFKQNRLYIFRTCQGTIQQLLTYSRRVDTFGEPTTEIKDKEEYHFLDALRYGVIGYGDGGLDLDEWEFY